MIPLSKPINQFELEKGKKTKTKHSQDFYDKVKNKEGTAGLLWVSQMWGISQIL